ncbi:endonuclease NucS [Methanobacterium sp. ACI-7]|uniref:endonuclease NucS n=1 Tax=unclassified Methanobacterium TaxID=2627676 RepID=UPI0039C03FB0
MENMKVKENPSVEETEELLKKGLKNRAVLIITACCKVFYEGRAKSTLESGDRVIIVKSDGSFLVHKGEKRNPVNWQPPGCNTTYKIEKGLIRLKSIRRKPKELLEVEISKTHAVMFFIPKDDEKLNLSGSERDMADYIYENPEVIEEGFKPLAMEKSISNGVIDIMGNDKDGKLIVLELKRGRATLDAVSQLKRYVDNLSGQNEDLRGIVVAPSITGSALKLLKSYGLEFISLNPPMTSKSDFFS